MQTVKPLASLLLLADSGRVTRISAHIVLSLISGIRTEEARALTWDRVDLEGDPEAVAPVPRHIAAATTRHRFFVMTPASTRSVSPVM
jgi:integrase